MTRLSFVPDTVNKSLIVVLGWGGRRGGVIYGNVHQEFLFDIWAYNS